ncbi:MAG: hypothetical protein ABDI07_12215 [Candidatus Kryptonium sp.]
MRTLVSSIALVAMGLALSGCAVGVAKHETGKPIKEENISKILAGQTTGTDVIGLFGAPTMVTSMGDDELYIYKYCRTGGTGITVPGLGATKSKEVCNELTVVIDKKTGKVKNYNYNKAFEP